MKDRKVYKSLLFSLLFLLASPSVLSVQASVDESPQVKTTLPVVEQLNTVVQGSGQGGDRKLFAKALSFVAQGEFLQAEQLYRDLIKRHSNWPEAKNNLAVILLKTDRLDEARALLESAVVSSPAYRVAQSNRTKLYNYLAMQAYNKALGVEQTAEIPELELIQKIDPIITVTEKKVDIERESSALKPRKPDDFQVSAGEAVPSQEVENAIRQQLFSWSKAWSEGDFDQYIQHYSMRFVPSDSQKTFSQWRVNRKSRLKYSKGVAVEIDQLRVFFESSEESDAEYALVEFLQYYQSALYKDKVLKQMYMKKQQKSWLILSERIIKTY